MKTLVLLSLVTCHLSLAAATAAAAPLPPDEQLRFADGIFLRGLHEDAIHEYVAFARDFPADPRLDHVFYRLGECYRRLGNENAALRFYARVEKDFPRSPVLPKAALRRAELALAAGRFDDAAAAAAPLVSSPPPDPADASAALYYLGRARRGLSDLPAAERAFDALLSAHPASPWAASAALQLAAIHDADSDPAARARVAAWFALAADSAATPATRAEALFRWGQWAYRLRDWRAAVDAFQQLRAEFPDTPRARAAALQAAWARTHLGQTADALALADDAYQHAADASTAASALYLRAKLLRDLGRSADALADFAALARHYPATPSAALAAYELMATHFARGEFELALAAIPPSPDPSQLPEVLWMRAESEAALSRLDLAQTHYSELSSSFPDSPRAPAALLRLAELARDGGRLPDAAELFRSVASRYPADPASASALRSAALAALRLGDPAQALADWNALLALDPPPPPDLLAEARLQRALAAHAAGRPAPEVLADLDAVAASALPGAPRATALYWRGAILSDADQFPDAEAAFRACLAAAPDPATDSLARTGLVLALQQLDRPDEAADQALHLLSSPDAIAAHPDLIDWLVNRRIDQERYPDAIAAARALYDSASDPDWRQIAAFSLGAALEASGDPSSAAEAYRSAAALPAHTREGALATLRLAALELAAGRPADASVLFEQAAANAPDSAVDLRARAYFGLGEAAEAAGRPEDAAKRFMAVAVLFDDPELTPRALSRAAALYDTLSRPAEADAARADLRARYPRSSYALSLPPPAE